MLDINDIQNIVAPYGCTARDANAEDVDRFANDISHEDRIGLGATWRNDWRAEFEASINHGKHVHVVTGPMYPGAIIFGATPGPFGSGQVWVLQTESFQRQAEALHGPRWSVMFLRATNKVLDAYSQDYEPLFNFKKVDQVKSLKWLKPLGFNFYFHPDPNVTSAIFVRGEKGKAFARSGEVWRCYTQIRDVA